MIGLRAFVFALVVVAPILPAGKAFAVPSFARQLGVECKTCHTVFPELTPYGRDFKRHGYTEAKPTGEEEPELDVPPVAPLAAMLQASYTHLDEALPDSKNDNVSLPDQMSLFYAGRVVGPLGAFIQFWLYLVTVYLFGAAYRDAMGAQAA